MLRRLWLPKAGRTRPACSTRDRKSTRLNSSHLVISYAVFCLKKKKKKFSRPCALAVAIGSTATDSGLYATIAYRLGPWRLDWPRDGYRCGLSDLCRLGGDPRH